MVRYATAAFQPTHDKINLGADNSIILPTKTSVLSFKFLQDTWNIASKNIYYAGTTVPSRQVGLVDGNRYYGMTILRRHA